MGQQSLPKCAEEALKHEGVKLTGQGSHSLFIICGPQSRGASSEVSEGQLLTVDSGSFHHCPANNELCPQLGLHGEHDQWALLSESHMVPHGKKEPHCIHSTVVTPGTFFLVCVCHGL